MKSRPRVLHTIGIARYTNIEYLFLLCLISKAARYSILHLVKQEKLRKFGETISGVVCGLFLMD